MKLAEDSTFLLAFDNEVKTKVFLVGYHITIADLYLFARLYEGIVGFVFASYFFSTNSTSTDS